MLQHAVGGLAFYVHYRVVSFNVLSAARLLFVNNNCYRDKPFLVHVANILRRQLMWSRKTERHSVKCKRLRKPHPAGCLPEKAKAQAQDETKDNAAYAYSFPHEAPAPATNRADFVAAS
jgi:hypothetical protein